MKRPTRDRKERAEGASLQFWSHALANRVLNVIVPCEHCMITVSRLWMGIYECGITCPKTFPCPFVPSVNKAEIRGHYVAPIWVLTVTSTRHSRGFVGRSRLSLCSCSCEELSLLEQELECSTDAIDHIDGVLHAAFLMICIHLLAIPESSKMS